MKNKVFKSLIVFVNVIIAVVAFAFTAGATSETENENHNPQRSPRKNPGFHGRHFDKRRPSVLYLYNH